MRQRKFELLSFILLLWLTIVNNAIAQNFPPRPVPPRLVNDFAGMLTAQEVTSLERKLVAFNDSSSTQIAVVTLKSLDGYAISDYAPRLAEKWGIGQKGLNNGLLILIKPQAGSEKGEVQIATGYGMEGVIPDLTASEIVDNEILPAFRKGDYYGGIDKATNTIMSLARGEYTADQYNKRVKGASSPGKNKPGIFFVILIIFLVMIFSRRGGGGGRNRRITSRSDLPFWLLMSMLGSGKSHHGSWGGFSGGGGFGGGGGGFGGFGGGSFGGGGAGGSW